MTSSNGHPAHQQSPASSSTTTTAASSSSQTPSAPPPVVSPSAPLADRFPVNSLQHLTLQSGEAISGRVYCTDETTKSLVLQTDLVHTTLAAEIRIIAVDSILSHQQQNATATTASFSTSGESDETSLFLPLPKINKKTLEDRERRAMRMAEDSLRHINQKVCV